MSEAVEGHLAVKMCGLEDVYQSRIKALRHEEERYVRRSSRIRAFNIALFSSGSSIIAFVTFSVYRARSGSLNVASVFYVLSLLQLPSAYLVDKFALAAVIAACLGRRRAEVAAARNEEAGPAKARAPSGPLAGAVPGGGEHRGGPLSGLVQLPPADIVVTCTQRAGTGTCKTHAASQELCGDMAATLSGVCFACAPGELLGVCGATGSGKSTLLAALLGQLQPLQPLGEQEQLQPLQQQRGDTCGGGVEVCGSVAYCAQVPWIMAGSSVRENITFGLPYEEGWYDTVVRACCLHEDLARMAAGDLTELGEGGAGLSGGQKARVALARACYCRPHVALLDDPLSAVDARVGRELFDGVLGPAGLMASRCGTTRLLVTHQEQFLPLCDRVLLLRSGRQAALGPWAEVEQLRREAAPAGLRLMPALSCHSL
eukprot:XP_001696159.1 ABC transporter, multidrug resistance associated protein [Chlamydomonas reinhardtii]